MSPAWSKRILRLTRESLKGKTLAMIFEKPSLRTRVTFDVGIEELGGHAVYLSPAEISLGKRESVHDVAKNLERMVHGIMIRTFAHEIVEEMARHAPACRSSTALTDFSHPCQAMADYLTMLEVKGRIAGLKVAYVGDGNNVAHSLMFAGRAAGCPRVDCHAAAASSPASTRPRGRDCVAAKPGQHHSDARSRDGRLPTPMWSTPTCGPAWGRKAKRRRARDAFRPYQVNAALFG